MVKSVEERPLDRKAAEDGMMPDSGRGVVEHASSTARHERIALFDNIKGLLIVLVVFGHVAHPVHNSNPALSAAFDIIYLFHMPLFVFMSGLFAKGAYRDGKLSCNRIISFLALGFAFQLALALINGAALTPRRICAFTSAPWYLISMACWYAATPLLLRLGILRGMAFSLAIALLWGMVDLSSGFLTISRTMTFLPCFALGYYLPSRSVAQLRERKGLWLAVGASTLIVGARLLDPNAYAWFFPMVYGDNPYENGLLVGMAQKLTALAAGSVLSLSVLKLAPTRSSRLTTLGQRTLQVYVLHRLIRAWLTFHTPLYDATWMNDPLFGTAAVMAFTAVIIALCSLPQLERPFARALSFRWIRNSR